MRTLIVVAASLALVGALAPRPAEATACNREIVVPIAFARGSTQWVHRGPGTTYVGSFKQGQSLTIGAAGGVGYPVTPDFAWARNSQDQWEISVAGPRGFSQSSNFGTEPFSLRLPASGKYTFTIYPCADWGEPGTVMIFTSPE
jgi:hypothetical protein